MEIRSLAVCIQAYESGDDDLIGRVVDPELHIPLAACEVGDAEFLALYLRHGGKVDSRCLVKAAALGQCVLVDILLPLVGPGPGRRPADLRPGSGTALHAAAKGCHARVIARLLAAGLDADAVDERGASPLDCALQSAGHPLRGYRASMSVAVLTIANQRLTHRAFHCGSWERVFGRDFLDDLWNTPIECALRLGLPRLPDEIWHMIHEYSVAKDYYECIGRLQGSFYG
jgi:hypothetical protein